MTKLLSRVAILGNDDISFKEVEVVEWGGVVRLKAMNGIQRDKFDKELSSRTEMEGKAVKSVNTAGMKALLISLCCVDEKGNYLFTKNDVDALNEKAAGPIETLYAECAKMNGLHKEAKDDSVKS